MTDHHACGCDDTAGLTRRSLLSRAALAGAGLTVTSMFGDVLTQTVYADSASQGDTSQSVLVVLSLRGGADGLSMVVPHAEAAYYAARPSTAVAAGSLLYPDATFGLHPAFSPLADLWESGRMTAIHAVGMAAPNRSHFSAMEELEAAEAGSSARSGWLNRVIGGLVDHSMLDGVMVGSSMLPTEFAGPATALAVNDFSELTMPYSTSAAVASRTAGALTRQYTSDRSAIGPAGLEAMKLAKLARPIGADETAGPQNGASYPAYSDLGDALATSAALIRSGAPVRAIAVDFGGWDHHIDLKNGMQSQLTELSQSVAAFFTDLGADLSTRVTVVTLSEFGRRLAQNGAAGADHGYGNCVLVLGAGVKGGQYYATSWPGLAAGAQVNGDLAVTTNYQDVLARILAARFPEVALGAVFPDLTSPGAAAPDFMSASS